MRSTDEEISRINKIRLSVEINSAVIEEVLL